MKNNRKFFFAFLVGLLLFPSCKETDSADVGSSILSKDDEITVKSDTFSVSSYLSACPAISLTPDSFLLGECETNFGIIRADILTQLACPEGFIYPDTLVIAGDSIATELQVDSVCLYLHYKNWYGDGNSPLGIAVHEIDRLGLQENQQYYSDLDVTEHCSLEDSTNVATSSKIVVPKVYTDSSYSSELDAYVPTIRVKLSDAFAERFFKIKKFPSQSLFNEQFKGLYIHTDFGGSTVLYVNDISMTVFYSIQVGDTVLHDTKSFYANEEVRQVNRYDYPKRNQILSAVSKENNINYIVSPANIYTRLSVRMDSIFSRIDEQLVDADLYRVYVNRANLTVDVLYSDTITGRPRDSWDAPAGHMMLIREDCMEEFFSKNQSPTDSVAIISTLLVSSNEGKVAYSYTYDLSSVLTSQLRSAKMVDELKFALVPVSVISNSATGTVISVKQLQTISATYIRSASNTDNPMDIEVVYSGFSLSR